MLDLGPDWDGFHIDGDTLTTDNGETYTTQELRFLRWERNLYASCTRALQNEAERAGTAGAWPKKKGAVAPE